MANPRFHDWISDLQQKDPSIPATELAQYYRDTYGPIREGDYDQWASGIRQKDAAIPDEELRGYYTQTYGEPEPEPGVLSDLGTRVLQGAGRIPGALTGIVDAVDPLTYLTGHALVSEGADWLGEKTGFQPAEWASSLDQNLSSSALQAKRDIDQAWEDGSAGDIAGAYLRHPIQGIGGLVAEAIPMTAAGGLIGRGIGLAGKALQAGAAEGSLAGRVGQLADKYRYAAGEGAIAGGATTDAVLEQGGDPRAAGLVGLGTAVTTGALGQFGAKVSQRLGLMDMDVVLAGGQQAALGEARRSLGTRILGGAAVEGLVEELPQSVTEQMWQNLGLGQPIMEGTARAGVEGALAGAVMGGGMNILSTRPTDILNPEAPAVPPTTPPADPIGQDPAAPPITPTGQAPIVPVTPQASKLPETHLEPAPLGKQYGLTGAKMNQRLAELGLQTYDQATKRWTPTEAAADLHLANDWVVGKRTGSNLGWDVAKIGALLQANPPATAVAAAAKPPKPPSQNEITRNALLQDSQDILDHLSDIGRTAALAGNQDTVVHPVRKLFNELRQLDVSTPEGKIQAQDYLDTYARKVESRKTPPKSAAAMDELVASFRFDLGMDPEETATPAPVVQAGTQTDVLSLTTQTQDPADADWVETLMRQKETPLATETGNPGTETPATATPTTDPSAELAPTLVSPETTSLPDVVGAIRTALSDAKGITPDQRETVDLWLNTPDGSDATFADIGEQLGISKQAAHKRVQTALATLRAHPAVKAFKPQIRGILSQARATGTTENAAPTADNLAALANQNGLDQLDQRSIATTNGQLVDTADLAEGGNLSPSTTKTQIGLTAQQTDLTGGSTDAKLVRSAREMSTAAREALAADPELTQALSEPGRAALAPLTEVIPDPAANLPTEEFIDAETGQAVVKQREPEPGELVWRQKEQIPELGALKWDAVPSSVREWFGGMLSNPNIEITQAWINDTIKTISSRLAPQTERVVGSGQGDTTQSPARLSAPDGGRVAPGLDRKNAALIRGTEPGTNDYQPAQSANEVAAASVGTFDPAIGEVTAPQASRYQEAQARAQARAKAYWESRNPSTAWDDIPTLTQAKIRTARTLADLRGTPIAAANLETIAQNADGKVAPKFGEPTGQSQPATRQAFEQVLQDVLGKTNNWRITVHDTVDQARAAGVPEAHLRGTSGRGAYGWVETKDGKTHATFILERVQAGQEMSAFLHEVGVHMGLEKILDAAQIDRLFWKINDWAAKNDGSTESQIAQTALARVASAQTGKASAKSEVMAYFVEEAVRAGIDPTAMSHKSELARWFRALWAAFKVALRKLGVRNIDGLTAQHVVDLVYGAARLELAGHWHGSLPRFRQFDSSYMSSGAGDQWYSWGHYVAKRKGVAEHYREMVVKKSGKQSDVLFDGKSIHEVDAFSSEYPDDFGGFVDYATELVSEGWPLSQVITDIIDDQVFGEDMSTWLQQNRGRFSNRVAEGNLHRVDANVLPEETMHWDKPLSEQPQQVQDAINGASTTDNTGMVYLHTPFGDVLFDTDEDILGADLYARMVALENNDAMNPQAYEHTSSKAASMFLDSIGIKALEHWDEPSRSKVKEWKRTKHSGAAQLVDANGKVVTPANAFERTALDMADFSGDLDVALAEANYGTTSAGVKDVLQRWKSEGVSIKRVAAPFPTDVSTNLVVFNDKNILTLGRAPGGDLSQIKYGEPSWAPPAQIQKTIDKLPKPLQDPTSHVVDAVRTAANKTHLGLAFTKDLADVIRAKAPAFKDAVDRYMTNIQAAKVERITRDKSVSDILARYHALKTEALQKPIAKFLADARVKGKWGYDPRQVTAANLEAWSPPGYEPGEVIEVDPAMAEAFEKLASAQQRVVVEVNKLLAENFQTTQKLITKNINRVYDKRIEQIQAQLATETDLTKQAKLAKSLNKTKADQAQTLKAFDKKLVKTKGPYAPLKRQGNYVVQAFSPELKALYDLGEERTTADNKRYHALRRDEAHYTLEFVANRNEARKRMDALRETFGEHVDAWEKTSWRDNTYVGLPEIDRLRSMVTEGVGGPGNARLVRDVENLALQVMADTHARQSQHHAKLTPGYDPDMIRAFVSQARADAHHISNLMYLGEINDAIHAMTRMVEDPKVRAQTDVDRDTLGRMVSELHRRWGDTLRHEPSPVIDRLAAVSSTWHLLLSPAYYFQNATQVGMMSVPWMAGTYGWANTQRATLKAYKDILPMVKDKARSWEHFDTKLVPEDVRHVIAALEASGQINIFMDMELGQAATTSNTLMGKAGRTFDQTIRRLPAKMETINRVVTAIAAYRLATEAGPKQMSVLKATEYAGKVLDITHGDYDGFNAPRWISSGVWGNSAKLLFQFRKFQLIQLAFYARMFNDMTASHPPEVRKAAGKALAFSLAHTTLAAGAMGLPALGMIQIIASLFGDDDEPNDKAAQDYKLRKAMQDGGMPDDMIDLVLGGLPTLLGIDMTGTLGSQNLLTPLPYTQLDPQKQGNFEALATAALGPTAGMTGKLYRGFGDLQRGEYYSGFEKILGSGLGDAVKAARLATKGEQTYNTDQAFSPDELGAWTAISAGLGFTPEMLSKRWASQRVVKSYETTFDRRTAEIKHGYTAAKESGSRKDIRKWEAKWRDLQDAKRRAKVQPSNLAELRQAPIEQRKRERQTTGGVKWDRGSRGLVESITGAHGI